MIIKMNEDVESYQETVALGLTGKQLIFSAVAVLTGAGIVLCLFQKIGIMASCYLATPFVIPIALMGFYEYNGMNFFRFFLKFLRSFRAAKPLLYSSTERKRDYTLCGEVLTAEKSGDSDVKKSKKAGWKRWTVGVIIWVLLLAVGLYVGYMKGYTLRDVAEMVGEIPAFFERRR